MATRVTPSVNDKYYINPSSLTFVEDSGYGVNLIQASASSSCYITVYDPENGIRYNVESGYLRWKVTAYNNKFPEGDYSAFNIYIRLQRSGTSALVVYDKKNRAVSGGVITTDADGSQTVGEADADYYYIKIGTVGATDGTSIRNITYDTGYLSTPESQNSAWDLLDAMFTPHYDDPNNPNKLSWIEAKSSMGIQGGVTMYIDGENIDRDSIYDGLPVDGDTIYWEVDENGSKVLKAKSVEQGATKLGELKNVGEWADATAAEDRIMVQKKGSTSWEALSLDKVSASFENVKESGEGNAYTAIELSEDKKTLTLKKGETFAKQSDYETLNTKVKDFLEGSEDTDEIINKWKELEAFLDGMKETDDLATILSGKADKATTLAGYGIADAKIADGVITLGGNSITPLTSHQVIYNLILKPGTFSAVTFDPNGASKTVYIPTTTSHISEGGNLYFTTARAVAAITGGASTITTSNLTVSRALISNSSGKVAVSAVTSTELGYLGGVTSPVQTQLDTLTDKFSDYLPLSGGTLTGDLRLKGDGNYGNALRFGDGNYVYLKETKDDLLDIYASKGVRFLTDGDGISIDGIAVSKSTDGVLYIDGSLVVKGGVTMFGDGSVTASTIMDAVAVDGTTIIKEEGVLKLNPNIDLGGGITTVTKQMVIDALGYTPYSIANPSGYITSSSIPTSLKNPYTLTVKDSAGTEQVAYDGSSAKSLTLTKAMVGLGNVENTALSTWTGSANITQLGTVTRGTWNGSKIANAYLANSAITINGTSISLGGSLNTASIAEGTAGTSSATSGYTLAVPYITINKYGIVTGYGTHTHTVNSIPNSSLANSSISISGASVSLGGSITQAALRTALGLGSNAYTSTAYLPLTGGTMTGNIIFSGYGIINGNIKDGDGNSMVWSSGTNTLLGAYGKGTSTCATYIRSTGNNLYHRKGNATSYSDYLILDASNYTNYTPLLNSSATHATSSSVIYAPTEAGTSGYVLRSNGSGAPSWVAQSSLSVGSATTASKLAASVKLWGNNFDGSSDIDGAIEMKNNSPIRYHDTAGALMAVLELSSGNDLHLGYGSAIEGYNTYISGNNLYLRYGVNRTVGMSINSVGNIFMYGNVIPDTTDTKSLGTSGKLWSNLYTKKATVDGIELYKSQSGVLYLKGSLVVQGGVTMYGTDGTTSDDTITSSLPIASTSQKGIAQFDSSDFTVSNGVVSLNGELGGISEVYALTVKNSAGTTQLTYNPASSAATLTLTKTMVGLGNVENTALSTWTGSANIKTLGTITSGVWNGTKIANEYLANSSITVSGTSISLGGSISQSDLRTALGLGSLAYKSGLAFSELSSKPTTLSGYGITDATPFTAYHFTNGCLVRLNVGTTAYEMVTVTIKGNAYGVKDAASILSIVEFYNYSTDGPGPINCHATHFGHDFGTISVFWYDGNVCLWFKQTSDYQSFLVYANGTIYGKRTGNIIKSVSDSAIPSSGITNRKDITPVIGIGSNNYSSYVSPMLAAYLPLAGGTLTGPLTVSSAHDTKLVLDNTDGEKYQKISFKESGTEYASILASSDYMNIYHSGGPLRFNDFIVLNASNYTNYTPLLNSSTTHATSSSVIYAPTEAGMSGYVLKSNGSGAPSWVAQSSLSVGNATTASKLSTVSKTAWGQTYWTSGGVPTDIENLSIRLYKNPESYTGGWARSVYCLSSGGADLAAFGFYGNGDALNYAYIGETHSSVWLKFTPTATTVYGNIIPGSTNAYTIGSSSYLWSNLYTKKATVDGIELYKSQSGVLYLKGNLVVQGGVTMYGTDGTTSDDTITSSLPIASTSQKGIAQFDSSDFTVSNGVVSLNGNLGLDESALASYLSSNNYLTRAAGDGRYLKLSLDGYISLNNSATGVLNFNSTSGVESGIRLLLNGTNGGGLWYHPSYGIYLYNANTGYKMGISDSGNPFFSTYTLVHAGNYTSYTPILNSKSTHATSASVIYAPTVAGASGYVLKSNGSGAPSWVAQSDLSAGSATKLSTSRLLWGQSFDGSADIDGSLTIKNAAAIYLKDSSSNTVNAMELTSSNTFVIGYGMCSRSYSTYLEGNNVCLAYGSSRTTGLKIDSSGYVGVRTSSSKSALSVATVAAASDSDVSAGKLYGENVFSIGPTGYYGLALWIRSTGKAYMQAGRQDGTATEYNLCLQPHGGQVEIGKDEPSPLLLNCTSRAPYISFQKNGTTEGYIGGLSGSAGMFIQAGLTANSAFSVFQVKPDGSAVISTNATYYDVWTDKNCGSKTAGKAKELTTYSALKFSKSDNSGYPCYLLIADVTSWYNATSGASSYGITGFMYGCKSGASPACTVEISGMCSFGKSYYTLDTSNTNMVIPRVVAYNSKYYLALFMKGANREYFFIGRNYNLLSSYTELKCSDSSGTCSGLAVVHEGSSVNQGEVKADNYQLGINYVNNLKSAGWYRFATATPSLSSGTYLFFIRRGYNSPNNESYIIAATLDYSTCNFTQIAGHYNAQVITSVRCTYDKGGSVYFDLYYSGSGSYANGVVVNAIGQCTVQPPTLTTETLTYTDILSLGDGFRSNVRTAYAMTLMRNETSAGCFIRYGANEQLVKSWAAGSDASNRFGWYYKDTSAGTDVEKMYLDSSGNLLATGGITMYSDIRKKTKLKDVELTLKQVADAPLIEHYYNSDEKKTTHVGSVAQYWAGLNDWFCKKDDEGFYTMELQNAALASAISIAREVVRFESSTDRRIRELEERVAELEGENKRLKRTGGISSGGRLEGADVTITIKNE